MFYVDLTLRATEDAGWNSAYSTDTPVTCLPGHLLWAREDSDKGVAKELRGHRAQDFPGPGGVIEGKVGFLWQEEEAGHSFQTE